MSGMIEAVVRNTSCEMREFSWDGPNGNLIRKFDRMRMKIGTEISISTQEWEGWESGGHKHIRVDLCDHYQL